MWASESNFLRRQPSSDAERIEQKAQVRKIREAKGVRVAMVTAKRKLQARGAG